VTSGRSIEEIAGAQDRVWYSNHEGPSLVDLVRQLPNGDALTNLDRVLFPEQGVTKAALIAYYAALSEPLLARIARRPLAVVRCPEGRTRCFFWKNPKEETPDALVHGKFLSVADQTGLIALGQSGALELHTWGCHVEDVEHPDELVIDLDPDEALPFSEVVKAAREVRERLKGLECFVKTTGGRGLHVVAPIAKATWSELKAFTRALAQQMHADAPEHYSATAGKKNRVGKIFVDSLRNVRGATAVAAYSPRARAGAPVSMPVSWDELERVKPQDYTLQTVPTFVAKREDPWSGYGAAAKQTLPAKAKRRRRPAA
jgi:bifunctional non-homologous end joining protein LigD